MHGVTFGLFEPRMALTQVNVSSTSHITVLLLRPALPVRLDRVYYCTNLATSLF